MSPAEALAFIDSHKWTFAKRYAAFAPHEYIVKARINDNERFEAFVRFIRENGKERLWNRKIYICWYAPDGRRYWTMGWPLNETTIINRGDPETDQTREVRDTDYVMYSSPDGQRPVL